MFEFGLISWTEVSLRIERVLFLSYFSINDNVEGKNIEFLKLPFYSLLSSARQCSKYTWTERPFNASVKYPTVAIPNFPRVFMWSLPPSFDNDYRHSIQAINGTNDAGIGPEYNTLSRFVTSARVMIHNLIKWFGMIMVFSNALSIFELKRLTVVADIYKSTL